MFRLLILTYAVFAMSPLWSRLWSLTGTWGLAPLLPLIVLFPCHAPRGMGACGLWGLLWGVCADALLTADLGGGSIGPRLVSWWLLGLLWGAMSQRGIGRARLGRVACYLGLCVTAEMMAAGWGAWQAHNVSIGLSSFVPCAVNGALSGCLAAPLVWWRTPSAGTVDWFGLSSPEIERSSWRMLGSA